MAVGEAACVSIHGANRLGSNSLTDLVVFGRAAGLRAAEIVKPGEGQREIADSLTDPPSRALRPLPQRLRLHAHLHPASGDAEGDAGGRGRVPHRGHACSSGVKRIADIYDRVADIRVTDRGMIWNTDLMETLEFDNLIGQAAVTVNSAVNRPESRGAHARDDYPDRNDAEWMKHTLAWLDEATGKVSIDYRPVHTYTMTNDVSYIPPKKRVY